MHGPHIYNALGPWILLAGHQMVMIINGEHWYYSWSYTVKLVNTIYTITAIRTQQRRDVAWGGHFITEHWHWLVHLFYLVEDTIIALCPVMHNYCNLELLITPYTNYTNIDFIRVYVTFLPPHSDRMAPMHAGWIVTTNILLMAMSCIVTTDLTSQGITAI